MIISQGNCGDNLRWVHSLGVLTIIGSGNMRFDGYYPPWRDFAQEFGMLGLPEGLTSIADNAFSGCDNVRSVVIPESVTSIGSEAFSYCEGLMFVTIGSSVRSIGKKAFEGCENLKRVDIIGSSVSSIGDGAFEGCKSLNRVTIPKSVTYIGKSAFAGCSRLKKVNFNAIKCDIMGGTEKRQEGDHWDEYMNEGGFEDRVLSESRLDDYHTYDIYYPVFLGCNIFEINIGNAVTKIPQYAFFGCDYVRSVIIPDSVKSIGYLAFPDNTKITKKT